MESIVIVYSATFGLTTSSSDTFFYLRIYTIKKKKKNRKRQLSCYNIGTNSIWDGESGKWKIKLNFRYTRQLDVTMQADKNMTCSSENIIDDGKK